MIYFERCLLLILFITFFFVAVTIIISTQLLDHGKGILKVLNNPNHLFYVQKDFLEVSNHFYDPFLRYLLQPSKLSFRQKMHSKAQHIKICVLHA